MLIPRRARCDRRGRHGSLAVSLAELRRDLKEPSALSDRHRLCLLDLAGRLARVQALGDEYAAVELSEYVTAAMERQAVAP